MSSPQRSRRRRIAGRKSPFRGRTRLRPRKWSRGRAVRPEQKQLASAIDAFLKDYYKSAPYNIAYRKYFQDPRGIKSHAEFRTEHPGELSPYDGLIRRYAGEAGFDWRLIASQM